MMLNATEYWVVFLYLFWITTILRMNILFQTNKCHHGAPLGVEGPGQLLPYPPLIRTCPWIRPKWHPYSAVTFYPPHIYLFDCDILSNSHRLWRGVVAENNLARVQHPRWKVVIKPPRHGYKLLSRNTMTWWPVTGGVNTVLPQHCPSSSRETWSYVFSSSTK